MVATEPHQVQWCRDAVPHLAEYGHDVAFLDREAVRAEVDSPTYIGGFWRKDGGACIDPARLAWGLAAAAERLGARIHEHSTVTAIEDDGDAVILRTALGRVRARRVILGTNAFPPLAKKLQRYILPVYDYVLMTEPLGAERKAAIGWANRQGLADMTNQFHYYRLTEDDRILWGGYDAIYHWNNSVDPQHERRDATYSILAEQFFETFPQLEGLRFSHAWAGAIDTCSRFSVFFGREFDGKLAYAAGYTGLGVGATRWGARVCLDLVDELQTARTQLSLVRKKPLPFPPEPFRSVGCVADAPSAGARRPSPGQAGPVAEAARCGRARLRQLSGRPGRLDTPSDEAHRESMDALKRTERRRMLAAGALLTLLALDVSSASSRRACCPASASRRSGGRHRHPIGR